jgi:hypothetical protein
MLLFLAMFLLAAVDGCSVIAGVIFDIPWQYCLFAATVASTAISFAFSRDPLSARLAIVALLPWTAFSLLSLDTPDSNLAATLKLIVNTLFAGTAALAIAVGAMRTFTASLAPEA